MTYRKILYKISQGAPNYLRFVVILLAMQLILRMMEFFLSNIYGHSYMLSDVLFGSVFDGLFTFSFALILFIPYFLLVLLNRKIANGLLYFCIVILAILGYGFSNYYALMMNPVSKVVFSYSLSDLSSIIQTGGSFDIYFFGSILFSLMLLFIAIHYLRKLPISRYAYLLIFLFMLISIFSTRSYSHKSEQKWSESTYYNRVNKMAFFINEVEEQLREGNAYEQKLYEETISEWRSYYDGRDFMMKEYPLLHNAGRSHVLSGLLNKENQPPNIIIVIVESLTRCYSGPNAWAGSYTPFLDSLAKESLYWENFVSTSERTIGILPSILGSLPSGKSGFSLMGGNMPIHLSLIPILKENNYQTNFYYGGDISFDNSNLFLSRQSIDYIESDDYYTKDGISYWGLSDSTVFQKSIEHLKKQPRNNPSLNIYLTLSTHGPFDIPGLGSTIDFLKKEYSKDFTVGQQAYLESHSEQMASFYYTDQQIKALFDSLKYIGALQNALFMVTGDHGVVQVCQNNPVKRYHVPFLLYSPQLKRAKSIKAINSHYNVTPSLLAFLEESYNLEVPDKVHWLGSDFDTTNHVSSTDPIPIMELNRSVDEVIFEEFFYSKGKLFQIKDGLEMQRVTNVNDEDTLKRYLDSYNKINRYVNTHDKLIFPSLYAEWGDTYELISVKLLGDLKIDSSTIYENIWILNSFTQKGNYRIEMDFNLEEDLDNLNLLPPFILEVTDSLGQRLSYNSMSWIVEGQESQIDLTKQFSLSIESSIPSDIPAQKCRLKAYFWNTRGLSYVMKDLKIRMFRKGMD